MPRLMIERVPSGIVKSHIDRIFQPLREQYSILPAAGKPVEKPLNMRLLSIFTILTRHLFPFICICCPRGSASEILSFIQVIYQTLSKHWEHPGLRSFANSSRISALRILE